MVVPVSDCVCMYFGVSPQPLLDKCLQCWVKKDLAFNTRGKNEKSGTGNLGKKTEHNLGRGSLSFSIYEIQETSQKAKTDLRYVTVSCLPDHAVLHFPLNRLAGAAVR